MMSDKLFLESLSFGGVVLLSLWVNLGLCALFSFVVVGLLFWRMRKYE